MRINAYLDVNLVLMMMLINRKLLNPGEIREIKTIEIENQ